MTARGRSLLVTPPPVPSSVPEVEVEMVPFSMRRMRADTRLRLHALALVMSKRAGRRITIEELVNQALVVGLDAIEAVVFKKALAKQALNAATGAPDEAPEE